MGGGAVKYGPDLVIYRPPLSESLDLPLRGSKI